MPTLFDPLTVGDLRLPNRILMAPLTRCRCDPGRVPTHGVEKPAPRDIDVGPCMNPIARHKRPPPIARNLSTGASATVAPVSNVSRM